MLYDCIAIKVRLKHLKANQEKKTFLKELATSESLFASVSKTSLCAKPFIWKCVLPTGSFSCKSNLFSYERFWTKTCFETEAQGNSEMAY